MKNNLSRICLFITVMLFAITVVNADEPAPFIWRKVENHAFAEGEYLCFRIRWGLIIGGYATLEVDSIEEINGRPSFVLISRAQSNKFFDVFFKVRDLHKSWVDAESICSHRFFKNLKEGRFKRWRNITYDHPAGMMKIDKGGGEIVVASITPFVQDILSSLYLTRVSQLKLGSEFSIKVNTNGKNWPLIVKVLRKEQITIPIGKFNCVVIEPRITDETLFDAKGRIWVWMTDDARHLPVMMKSKIAVGSITAELVDTTRLTENSEYDIK
ncbi:MAG: DUF3108 domain-containing protein [bacterium]